MNIRTADQLLPLCFGIAVLKLGDRLHDELTEDPRAAAEVEHPLEIWEFPDIAELLQAHIDGHGQPPMLAVTPAVFNKTGEKLREEQGTQELQRGVLRGDAAEVGAGLLTGKRQVDLVVGSDFVYQRVLEYRQSVAQSNGDVAPDLPVGQLENAVGRQRRMAFGQRLKAPFQISKGLV